MTLPRLEALDDEHAGQSELATGEGPRTGGRHRNTPRGHDSTAEFFTRLRVDDRDGCGQDRSRTQRRPFADLGAFCHDAAAADVALVADHDRDRVRWLEDAADTHAPGEVHVLADLSAGPHGGPRVDHGVLAHVRPDVHVGRHHHDTLGEMTAPPGRGARDHPDAGRRVVGLEGHLVCILEGPEFGRLHGRQAEEQQDRVLQPLVDGHALGAHLGDPLDAGVEEVDGLPNRRHGVGVCRRELVTAVPEVVDRVREGRHGVRI